MKTREVAGLAISWFVFSLVSVSTALFLGLGYLVLWIAIRHLLVTTPPTSRLFRRIIFGKEFAIKRDKQAETAAWPSAYWILSNICWFALAILALWAANIRLLDLFTRALRT